MISKSKTAIWGSFAIFTGALGRQILQFVEMLILARLISKEDFGVVAIVLSAVVLFQVFADLGITVALVQRKKITSVDIDSGFSLSISFAFVNVIILWFFSDWAASFYNAPVLASLFKIAAFSFFFKGIFSLYRCLLLRDLKFKYLAVTEFIGSLVSVIVIIILALYQLGAFSIIWGKLVESIVLLVMGFAAKRYIPKSPGTLKSMIDLFKFGIWVSLYRLIVLGANQFDKFIIGKIMPMANLGGFYIAQRITYLLPELIMSAVDQVMLPLYSQIKDDRDKLVKGYWRGLQYSIMLIFPVSALMMVLAKPIVIIFLSEKWLESAELIQVLSFYAISLGLGGGGVASLLYAINRPKFLSLLAIFRLITLPTGIIIGSHWGIIGIAWGITAFGFIHRIFVQSILFYLLKLKVSDILKAVGPTVGITAICIFVGKMVYGFMPEGGFLLSVTSVSVVVIVMLSMYVLLYFKLIPEASHYLLNEVKSRISGRK